MNLNFHASMEGLGPFDSEEKLIWNGSGGDGEEENDYSALVVMAFLVVGSSTVLEVVSAV